MSAYDDQLTRLQSDASEAFEQLAQLPRDAWSDAAERDRFAGIVVYAQEVLTATDAALVSSTAATEVGNALRQISTNATSVPANAEPWGTVVLDALARLPIARGREVEQAVKDLAATFQRSAQQRLVALRSDFTSAQFEISNIKNAVAEGQEKLRGVLDNQQAEATQRVEALQSEFGAKLTEYEGWLRDERAAISELRTKQVGEFEEAEQQRLASARDHLQHTQDALRELQEHAEHEVLERVEEIRRMERESAELVGAIGLAGTSERYGEEARAQKEVADTWRLVTVAFALIAVVGAVFAVAEKHPVAETFAGKLALSLVLGGIATYAARQSSLHRHREQRARDLQLELTAFSPFIESLSKDQQEEERVIMTRKTFGRASNPMAPDEEPGPTFLSFALQRRRASNGAETPR